MIPAQLTFLLDDRGALIAYQQNDASWGGILAFSDEARATQFIRASKLQVAEFAAVSSEDASSIAVLIAQVKKRAIRNLILDLDYQTGRCIAIDFEGDRLGPAREHQFTPRAPR